MSPLDPLMLLGTPALLALGALLASYLPARRAVWVDPMIALRGVSVPGLGHPRLDSVP